MEKLIYKEPGEFSDREIMDALKQNDPDLLQDVCMSVAINHDNWKLAQDICVLLSEHSDPNVRACSIMGIAYTAIYKGKLEKNIVKPVLLRALKDEDEGVRGSAELHIDDVNQYMSWNIGGAKKRKDQEKRYHERKRKS